MVKEIKIEEGFRFKIVEDIEKEIKERKGWMG